MQCISTCYKNNIKAGLISHSRSTIKVETFDRYNKAKSRTADHGYWEFSKYNNNEAAFNEAATKLSGWHTMFGSL